MLSLHGSMALQTHGWRHFRQNLTGCGVRVTIGAALLRVGFMDVIHAPCFLCDANRIGACRNDAGVGNAIEKEIQQLVIFLNAATKPHQQRCGNYQDGQPRTVPQGNWIE